MRYGRPLRSEDPSRVHGYRLTGRLGEGGQGVVYLAVGDDGEPVALKLLHSRMLDDADAHRRLVDEITLVRRVADFCTARILDFGADGDRSFVVTEYVDGPSLRTLVEAEGPMSGGALARLMVGTASALAATHQAGVLHRDFTPHNVLVGPDGPRVIDFGIARALNTAATMTSGIVGTPAYTAPEMLGGDTRSGPESDMFAWGATMAFAATGRVAYGSDSVAAVFGRILHDEPDLDGVPSPFHEVLSRCLDKDPERRPAAHEVLLQLLGYQDVKAASSAIELPDGIMRADRMTVDRPEITPLPASRTESRRLRNRLVIASALVVVALCAGGTYALTHDGRPPNSAGTPPVVPPPEVTVGSADFAESRLLAEIYAQELQAKGYRVTRSFDLGQREAYLPKVESGAIDVIPEYTGALATSLNGSSDPIKASQVDGVLREALPPRLRLLTPSAAEDKDSVTVTRRTAELYGLRSIADLKPVADAIVMGGSPEFQTRHQGLVGLRGTYGVGFHSYQPFATDDASTMVRQLKENVIQAANLFTTDPSIAENGFVVLTDPEHLFSAENVTPLIYRSALSTAGVNALNAVSAKLTTHDLLAMNTRVQVNKVDASVVARDWLRRADLIN